VKFVNARVSIALHRTPRAFSHWNPQRQTHHELSS
jgi:hypothetical protein